MTNLTQILFSYDFLVVAIGTVLLAIPSAIDDVLTEENIRKTYQNDKFNTDTILL